MANFGIELTNNVLINNIGLVYIAKFLNNVRIFSQINRIARFKKNTGFISDYDIVKTSIGLIALGKTSFE